VKSALGQSWRASGEVALFLFHVVASMFMLPFACCALGNELLKRAVLGRCVLCDFYRTRWRGGCGKGVCVHPVTVGDGKKDNAGREFW